LSKTIIIKAPIRLNKARTSDEDEIKNGTDPLVPNLEPSSFRRGPRVC